MVGGRRSEGSRASNVRCAPALFPLLVPLRSHVIAVKFTMPAAVMVVTVVMMVLLLLVFFVFLLLLFLHSASASASASTSTSLPVFRFTAVALIAPESVSRLFCPSFLVGVGKR